MVQHAQEQVQHDREDDAGTTSFFRLYLPISPFVSSNTHFTQPLDISRLYFFHSVPRHGLGVCHWETETDNWGKSTEHAAFSYGKLMDAAALSVLE